jgi:hypothetical protein
MNGEQFSNPGKLLALESPAGGWRNCLIFSRNP